MGKLRGVKHRDNYAKGVNGSQKGIHAPALTIGHKLWVVNR